MRWTQDAIHELAVMTRTMNDVQISNRLGISPLSVANRRGLHGLYRRVFNALPTEAEDLIERRLTEHQRIERMLSLAERCTGRESL